MKSFLLMTEKIECFGSLHVLHRIVQVSLILDLSLGWQVSLAHKLEQILNFDRE